jgi:putative FmdB family regulatory protein
MVIRNSQDPCCSSPVETLHVEPLAPAGGSPAPGGALPCEEKGMPIYEYACETCHRSFEELQKIGDGARPSCPSCATDYKATPQKKDPGGEAAA